MITPPMKDLLIRVADTADAAIRHHPNDGVLASRNADGLIQNRDGVRDLQQGKNAGAEHPPPERNAEG